MRLIPYDKKKLNTGIYKKSKNYKLLMEFVESGLDCAKVEGYTQADAYGCSRSLTASAKRYHIDHVRSIVRKGEVFLVKEL